MSRTHYSQIKLQTRTAPKHVASQTPGDVLDRCSICGIAVHHRTKGDRSELCVICRRAKDAARDAGKRMRE